MGARTRGLANNVLSSGKLDATDAVSGVIPASNIADASLTSATTFGSVTGGVPAVASDPPSPAEGDIWYNTTTGQIKFRTNLQSWSSGGNLNTARRGSAGAGIQTAALSAGGGEPAVTNTELYDGSSWSEVNDLSTARRLIAGLGLQTAALAIGGFAPPTTGSTEEFDGTNWTAGGSLNTGRYGMAAAGIQTAGIAFGGDTPNVLNESYNGTSWTEVGDLNTGGTYLGGFGLQTAAIAVKSATVELWNGTSWTEVNDLNTGRSQMGCSGIQTAGLAFGGNGPSALTESWDGTSWTEVNDLGTARAWLSGSTNAPNTTTLAFGGTTGSDTAATEEWTTTATTQIVG